MLLLLFLFQPVSEPRAGIQEEPSPEQLIDTGKESRILAPILTHAGNLFAADGDYEGALAAYAESLPFADQLKDEDPEGFERTRNLFSALNLQR